MDSPAPKRSPWPLLAVGLLACAALPASACAPPNRAEAAPAGEQLPPYGPDAAALFDDSIAPQIFGATLTGTNAASDPALPRWTEQAESVLPVKISTISSDSVGDNPAYTLELQPVGAPLAGRSPAQSIDIEITPTNPSYAFVHSADSTLVGKEFILFFRRYSEQGRTTLHWRAEADTAGLRAAIERARLVGGFGR